MKLVTAIMPTRGRREWAMQAVECFLAQTYQNKELWILDDIEDPSFPHGTIGLVTGEVNLECAPGRWTIASKRNHLTQMAQGEIIWTLDDDDWSAPERMADQVQRLEESGKAVTGYCPMLMHDGEQAWRYHIQKPEKYALGTSLCYLRSWALDNPFQDSERRVDRVSGQNIASDNDLVERAVKQDQLISVDAGQMMVARMHPKNTSSSKWVHRHQSPNYRRVPDDQLPEGFLRVSVVA